MKKKLCFTISILLLCLLLSGCSFIKNDVLGIGYSLSLDEDMHIKFNRIDDEHIEYQGNVYYLSDGIFFYNEPIGNGYEYIGWSGSRWWRSTEIWGDRAESPTFLYFTEWRQTYFNENYDYRTDMFSIAGTDDVICFGEDLLDTDYQNTNLFNRQHTKVELSSVNHPFLNATLFVVSDNGKWYAMTNTQLRFELSDSFVEILRNNIIID